MADKPKDELQKAEEELDAHKRLVGAIPPLPHEAAKAAAEAAKPLADAASRSIKGTAERWEEYTQRQLGRLLHPPDRARELEQVRSGKILPKNWRGPEQEVAATIPQRERSVEKTPVSEGSWVPKNGKEWLSASLWGVIVLGFGLEFCASLVRAEYGNALVAAFFFAVVSAMVLHGDTATKWALSLSPNWGFVGAIIALQIVFFLPFIEQKQWPFSEWFPITIHERATPAEIAKATSEIQARLDQAIKERDAAKRETAKGQQSTVSEAKTSSPSSKSGDEIGYITLDYSNGGATITGTSYSIKEAIVQAARLTGSLSASSIGNAYSLPIEIVFNEEIGSVDVFVAQTDIFTTTHVLPNVAVTKNDGSHLEVLLTLPNSFLATMGFSRLLLSFRKR